MQALRDRQKDEKARLDQILQYKKQERLLKRRAAKQEAGSDPAAAAAALSSLSSKDSGIGTEDGGKGGMGDAQEDEDYDSDTDLSVSTSRLTRKKNVTLCYNCFMFCLN